MASQVMRITLKAYDHQLIDQSAGKIIETVKIGVGGDDSWGANVHPEYIPDVTKPVEITFTFRGI